MTGQSVLINFKVPKYTKIRFDEMCLLSARTRTSVLVEMIENFILLKGMHLEEENKKLKKLDHDLQERRKILGFKQYLEEQSRLKSNESEPLSFYFDDGSLGES